ncbi:tRNA (adenosine(37)-N6)-dimethylallyltransferase MiaA [Candidatus Synechococcus calcipolaris G9]|uniref:tRNA dimethylallyltransferase n=1 Tax=Candidatus Synechococcus calcipolaris G9 TaxID=1497997 RepID=A0ABT6EYT7_9SYNE|nr:tRNA (adenosine(37)-N6)-dimethylallyltransferase MiaA [Candidatus Synechococcus calcipolaris]MDG2990769.1 tRNA (adenosine(37)-N6)-dimethylallyltransferase MiaA [Candidatus Synechococcus calcipolaris G9]
MEPGLIVIGGATATGKTRLAIALAQACHTVILNADSRQVYRGLDIGTAKPSPQEQQQVPHYLLDLCPPDRTFTLADYQTQAQDLITTLHGQGITPILVGGTGLYIRSITQGLGIPRVPPHPVLRSQLSALGQDLIYQWLGNIDPAATQRIHPHDRVRTLRALEVYYVTGEPLTRQQRAYPPAYRIDYFYLEPPPLDIYRQILHQRTEQMLEMGWLTEIQNLGATYGRDLPLLSTLGYREMGQYLWGDLSLNEAIAATVNHTRQFGKRQCTWFRSETRAIALGWPSDVRVLLDHLKTSGTLAQN